MFLITLDFSSKEWKLLLLRVKERIGVIRQNLLRSLK